MKKKLKAKHGIGIQCSISGDGELLVYGFVGDEWDELDAKSIIDQVHALDTSNGLVVRINSGGGYVFEGLAIYNFLKGLAANVTVIIDGLAASMASGIAMAGDVVRMPANGLMMIHNPWDLSIGDADQLRKDAAVLDKVKDSLISIYADKTGLDTGTISDMMAAETWLNAEEALAGGFIDDIIDEVSIENLTRVDVKNFHNAPEVLKHPGLSAVAGPLPGLEDPSKKPRAASGAPTDEGDTMTDEQKKAADKAEQKKAAAEIKTATDAATAAATRAERKRAADIRAATKAAKLDADFADQLVNGDLDIDGARAAIIDKWAEQGGPTDDGASHIQMVNDAQDKRVEAFTSATLARVGVGTVDNANPFRGYRLTEVARACAENSGINTAGMNAEEYIRAAFRMNPQSAQTTSDFPVILEDVIHKMVLGGYNAQAATWQRFCRQGDVTDFREWKRLVPGLLGDLDTVNEKGEYLNKNFPDAEANVNQVIRRGNILEVTPEVIINDDLAAIMTMANELGAVGNRAIERAVYILLNANPDMSDGVALFHADHGNLAASGAVPSVITLDAAGAAMAIQTAPGDDAEYLDIVPDVALANRSQKGSLQVIVNAVYDPDTANKLQKPNAVNGIVNDVVTSPRVTTTNWYLFANPSINPVIEVVFLNGQRAPRIIQEENFRTSGLAWKVELPFGVGAIDYRGAYKNPGA